MIEHSISALSNERATELASKGLYARAKAATPLLELVKFTSAFTLQSETGIEFYRDASDNAEHNGRQEEVAQFIADRVSEHISFIRNTVAVAVERVLAATNELVKGIQIDPFSGYQVREIGVPPLLGLEDFAAIVAKYETGSTLVPTNTFRYPAYTDAQLIEACHTGSANIDTIIDAWLASLPEGTLQTLWQSVFQDKNQYPVTVPVQTLETLLRNPDTGLTNAVILVALCERLGADIGSDCGLELGEARELFFGIRQACATTIRNGVARYQSFNLTKTMVMSMDPVARVVEVHKDIYQEWLAAGGKVEVLYGLLVLRRQASSVSEVNAMAQEALDAWNYHTSVLTTEQDLAFTAGVREAAITAFEADLEANVDDSEKEALASIPNKGQLVQQFRTHLAQASSDQIRSNWSDAVWRAMVKARFFYTAAEAYLGEVNYGVNQRGLSPEDAASAAAQNYVARFMADMVEITA